jgi:catechol 2,3-dioxygenase-like lactoylglutathione lyase family enzyme
MSGKSEARAQQPNGVHHLAVMAADIKTHITFFADVLGCPLVALFPMHGVPGGLHAFLKLHDHCYFSVVQLPGVDALQVEIGRTHSGTGAGISAPGTLQHLAFNVDNEAALLAMRDRIRAHGVNVLGPIDHGMCKSIYFAGPDQMTLEIATSAAPINPRAWLDPATLAQAGIDDAETARFTSPAPYGGPGQVPQPPYDPAKPHQAFPAEIYQTMLSLPDDVITATGSYAEPPVKLPA